MALNIFKRMSYFRKLLVSYSVIVLVPTVLLSIVSYYYYMNQMKDHLAMESGTVLQNYSSLVSTMTSEIDRLSLQFSFIPELSEVMKNMNYSPYNYRVLQNRIQTSISSNQLIDSVYLYTKMNQKVLTTSEGIYQLNDFYDKSLVELAAHNEDLSQWHEVRSLKRQGDSEPTEVITFSRKIAGSSKESLAILIFNIRKDVFFETTQMISQGEQLIYVMDYQGRVVYPSMKMELKALLEENYVRLKEADSAQLMTITIGPESFLSVAKTSSQLGWTFVRLIPMGDYHKMVSGRLSAIVTVIAVVTILFIGFAYVLSVVMYVPFKRIVAGVSDRLKTNAPANRGNELDWVETAIDHIMNENKQIKESIELNQPIIRERWVYDMLNQNMSPEQTLFEHRYREIGIDFPHPNVLDLTVYIDLREQPEQEHSRIRLVLFSLIESTFQQHFGVAGTILDDERLGYILNTDRMELDEEFCTTLKTISYPIIDLVQNELDINLQLLYGNIHHSLQELGESRLANKGLRYKTFINQVDVVFAQDLRQNEDARGYPSSYVNMLLTCIKSADTKKAFELIHQLFETHVYNSKTSREHVVENLVVMLGAIVHELRKDEDDWNETITSSKSLLRLNEVHSKQELETFFKRFIESLAQGRNPKAGEKQNQHIVRAIEYMKVNYNKNMSISDIADHLQISSSYLSRVFKAEVGKSPQEYLTEYRIERGKEYLEDHRLSMQEISNLIGYSDSHSFIRYFKKYTGTTPGEYRNRFMNHS